MRNWKGTNMFCCVFLVSKNFLKTIIFWSMRAWFDQFSITLMIIAPRTNMSKTLFVCFLDLTIRQCGVSWYHRGNVGTIIRINWKTSVSDNHIPGVHILYLCNKIVPCVVKSHLEKQGLKTQIMLRKSDYLDA